MNRNKTIRTLFALFCVMVLTFALTATAFADGDPIAVVNKLSDFIFGLIRAVGIILLGFGVLQLGLICANWNLTESQFQIRQYGSRRIDGNDDRFACMENPYGEIIIMNYLGNEREISIPQRIGGKPVTAVSSP